MWVGPTIVITVQNKESSTMAQTTPEDGPRGDQQFFSFTEVLATDSRRDIVADIVAHPKGLPSMKELEFTTGFDRSTIRGHLHELAEAGVVTVVEFPVGERTKGQPSKFYGITDEARQFFDRNNVFIEDHWKELYTRLDKPDDIQAAEEAPCPTR